MIRTEHCFTNLANPVGRVRKIQNPRRVGTMEIDKALNPFRTITYGRELLDRLDPSAVEFTEREPLKYFRFRHP